ncbi:hypothetical protein [Motilibacter deserti]|uniref:Uncharacterized protein n=1 Tax=Motilibacter deserti TaxID=2714956 RepID=A0ABX0GP86_9ACTN|nr:hypothetical protein [Motilibacter deserti]NHC12656.1 hypothetical protein [Motilibacter deserti]
MFVRTPELGRGGNVDWGTVPAWVGSVLTGASLLLGFYILLRDRRNAEQEQARQVAYWWEDVWDESMPEDVTLIVLRLQNMSNAPIINPEVEGRPRTLRELRRQFKPFLLKEAGVTIEKLHMVLSDAETNDLGDRVTEIVKPGEEREIRIELPFPPMFYSLSLLFYDGAGRYWQSDLKSRELRLRKYRPLAVVRESRFQRVRRRITKRW